MDHPPDVAALIRATLAELSGIGPLQIADKLVVVHDRGRRKPVCKAWIGMLFCAAIAYRTRGEHRGDEGRQHDVFDHRIRQALHGEWTREQVQGLVSPSRSSALLRAW